MNRGDAAATTWKLRGDAMWKFGRDQRAPQVKDVFPEMVAGGNGGETPKGEKAEDVPSPMGDMDRA